MSGPGPGSINAANINALPGDCPARTMLSFTLHIHKYINPMYFSNSLLSLMHHSYALTLCSNPTINNTDVNIDALPAHPIREPSSMLMVRPARPSFGPGTGPRQLTLSTPALNTRPQYTPSVHSLTHCEALFLYAPTLLLNTLSINPQ